jgi:hypothetical protein
MAVPLPSPGDDQADEFDGYDKSDGPPEHAEDCQCGHCPKEPE